MSTESKKNTKGISRLMQAKGWSVVVVISLILIILVVQLFRLQVMQGGELQSRAVAQQLSDVTLSANRGQIYASDGTILALTREVYTVIMAPCNIKTDATRQKIVDELSVLLDVDKETLSKQVSDSESQYKVVKSKIEKDLGDTFIEWVNKNGYSGIFRIVSDYKREYPLKNTLSSVLGFVGKDGAAREGLELLYDEVLAGTTGRMVIARNSQGDALPNTLQYEYTVDAEDGGNLVLTIDPYIQQTCEKYLEETLELFQAQNRGCAIVMEVATGRILGLACKYDYDPNNYTAISDPTAAARIAQLAGDEKNAAITEELSKQYRNKALDFYEPGSVFKTFTASMGLEEGIVTENSHFYCGGSITVVDRTMRCWVYPRGHGQQTFLQAIANSCNPSFMTLGTRIGPKLFSKYYVGFGFTEKTGVDLCGEPGVAATLYHPADQMSVVDVATSSIGQTFKVTPVQMITALSAAANGGYLMQPYVVEKIVDGDGNVISKKEPTVRRQVISNQTSKRVSAMLENAVSSGAIKNAYIAGYRVAGKTGTAEKTETKSAASGGRDDNVKVVASFGGFAPADDPKVAVLVMVDDPMTVKSGGSVAAPLGRKILKDILPYLGVEPSYSQNEISNLDRSTPGVVGQSATQATLTVKNAMLNAKMIGNGGIVKQQVPSSGATIPKNGTVWIYTDDRETEMTTVPDFNGMTVAQVNQTAIRYGLNVLLSGISSSADGTPTASGQSLLYGTQVPKGSVVTVEFTYADRIY